ncbi:putative thiol peroxidase, partial [Haemophilus influenzae]
PPRGGFLLC